MQLINDVIHNLVYSGGRAGGVDFVGWLLRNGQTGRPVGLFSHVFYFPIGCT